MIGEPAILSAQLNKSLYMLLLTATIVFVFVFSITGYTETSQGMNQQGYSSKNNLRSHSEMVDNDGDGLSDFQEVHKYLTDPMKKDTDRDGVPDGDWNERREYTYSVRSILRFMPPLGKDVLNDDYQDVQVLGETDDYVEIEVIHYPLATPHESIEENPNWQQDYAGLTEYLKPGITTNWDAKMRQDLLAELKADGIIVDELTDKQVVIKVSSWLMKKSRYLDKVFTTFYIYYPNGQPKVYPGLEDAFEHEFGRDKENYDWTINQHFDHELLGKGMFYNKTHGSCTSFAVYLTTVLRALGIPTRMVILSPVVDASNSEQLIVVKECITHNKVREIMMAGLRRSSKGFTNHTVNEVYVGNRWCRLNYNKLGQPVLDQHLFGLQTHVRTFNDLSEVNLAPTWGRRYAKNEKSAAFKHSNPYSAVAISDLFGSHSKLSNPPFTVEDISSSPLPNIFIMEPSRIKEQDFSIWDEILPIVKDATFNKTGRIHKKDFYDNIFNGVYTKKADDIIVLFFSLDTNERIPVDYEDLLPKSWQEIEADLQKAKTVELMGKARDLNIFLLAAPRREQLKQLIQESELLRFKRKYQIEERKSQAGTTRSTRSSDLPNIFIMSPSGISIFREVLEIVQDVTWNKTGRFHEKKSYDEIFDGTHNKKTNDVIVLLFSLDRDDRIPAEYEDLLPVTWPAVELALKQGKTLELKSNAREMNIIVLATPTAERLRQLVSESNLLSGLKGSMK